MTQPKILTCSFNKFDQSMSKINNMIEIELYRIFAHVTSIIDIHVVSRIIFHVWTGNIFMALNSFGVWLL